MYSCPCRVRVCDLKETKCYNHATSTSHHLFPIPSNGAPAPARPLTRKTQKRINEQNCIRGRLITAETESVTNLKEAREERQ